ncbi:MAG: Uma2 family endonuclease [Planctomycetales bacterium]
MVIATVARTAFDESATLADLLDALGDISPGRVRLHPPPGAATETDVTDIRDDERRLYELVDGVLVEKVKGFRESIVACVLIQRLGSFVKEHDLGVVTGEAGMLRLARGLVRIPDVSFIAWSRFSDRRIPDEPIPNLAPDLSVEILSAGNTPREIKRKLTEYFDAGVRLAWIIDPGSKSAEAYTSPTAFTRVTGADALSGRDVAPGFQIPLAELFADLDSAASP